MKTLITITALLFLSCATHTYRVTPSLLAGGPGYAEDLVKNVTGADSVWLVSVNKKWAVFKYK